MPFAVIPHCIPTCLSAAIGGREDDNVKMTPNEKMSVIMARVRACREHRASTESGGLDAGFLPSGLS